MGKATKKELPDFLILRGKTFTKSQIKIFQRIVNKDFDKGRTFISKAICEKLEWRQPNGWLKDRACRDVMLSMAKLKLIKLPPPKVKKSQKKKDKPKVELKEILLIPIKKLPQSLILELAKGNNAEQIWNQLVNTYHYLGHKVVVGRCLKYLVKADGIIVGAISFSSASWHLASRNKLLTKFMSINEIRDLVINNSRFLILPNAKVPNLASTILSLATKQVVTDWSNYYSIVPQFVETFVEPAKFYGTCYKAANWVEIGITKGYAKHGSSFHNSQSPKQIFLYGLNKRMRKELIGSMNVDISD